MIVARGVIGQRLFGTLGHTRGLPGLWGGACSALVRDEEVVAQLATPLRQQVLLHRLFNSRRFKEAR